MSQLSNYLNKANKQKLTQMQIVKEAASAGLSISQTTVSRYLSGLHPTPASRAVLEVFSQVFDIPLGRLLRLGGLPTEMGAFELPDKAQVLDKGERDMVLALVSFLADRKIAAAKDQHSQASITPAGTVFDPAGVEDHRYLAQTYGQDWEENYYQVAARRTREGEAEDEAGLSLDETYLGGGNEDV